MLILSACSPVQYLKIEIGEPGKEDLAENIRSLTLVNRAVDERFENIREDSIQKIYIANDLTLDTILYDITAADTVIRALGELLFESGRYDIVIPEYRFLAHRRNAFFSEEMPWGEVKELCDTFHTDAVLSLENFKTLISTTYDDDFVWDVDGYLYNHVYVGTMAILYEAFFRVYDPSKNRVANRTFLKDTLIWQEAGFSKAELLNRITTIKGALIESGIAAALDYSEKISNSWHSETRKYYKTGDQLMGQAHNAVQEEDWLRAIETWQNLASREKKGGLKSKAEYNIALGYEMLGDIREAIKWGVLSYKTQYRPLTVEYLEILQKRKVQLDKFSKNE